MLIEFLLLLYFMLSCEQKMTAIVSAFKLSHTHTRLDAFFCVNSFKKRGVFCIPNKEIRFVII